MSAPDQINRCHTRLIINGTPAVATNYQRLLSISYSLTRTNGRSLSRMESEEPYSVCVCVIIHYGVALSGAAYLGRIWGKFVPYRSRSARSVTHAKARALSIKRNNNNITSGSTDGAGHLDYFFTRDDNRAPAPHSRQSITIVFHLFLS